MAPEVWAGGGQYGPPADIYSLVRRSPALRPPPQIAAAAFRRRRNYCAGCSASLILSQEFSAIEEVSCALCSPHLVPTVAFLLKLLSARGVSAFTFLAPIGSSSRGA